MLRIPVPRIIEGFLVELADCLRLEDEEIFMILVTGGAGFIGANFVLDWLAKNGYGQYLQRLLKEENRV